MVNENEIKVEDNLTLEEWYNGYRQEDKNRKYKRYRLNISEIDVPVKGNTVCTLPMKAGYIRIEYS